MAKKGQRQQFGMVCSVCKRHNYTTERNKQNTQEALTANKYCPVCKKRTKHTEKKKLH
ncbi:MAG: 50S ribosomal protein L33 [Candidatus Roizmanbacteria bacterium]|uniref:Large ribosomal subunit protein bL33 n=1 Tax=Candidatus Roizmanbacteria bacterium CG10_big_fil_rev_8_21_14_0_10_45_7 TaxID=1974854 RepID=A0A2M8KUY2_9BACT|nr:50S ribosomal protein L33 [Candidatus Roizmanbacteria bacterium]PJE63748.1 MAG: 50S ribosomal protein L33 [Candidatus Roizmanbacteria bacterium CG10_big_fil_rev_8_21_14_0_10_45_7]